MDINLRNHYIELFDRYSELLTDKQKNYFISYYFDDLSLSEMAEIYNISRNACHDAIKKTCDYLEEYEAKLGLLKKYKKLNEALELDDIDDIKKIIEDIVEV